MSSTTIRFDFKVYQRIVASPAALAAFSLTNAFKLSCAEVGDMPSFKEFITPLAECFFADYDLSDPDFVVALCQKISGVAGFEKAFRLAMKDSAQAAPVKEVSSSKKKAVANIKAAIAHNDGDGFEASDDEEVNLDSEESEEESDAEPDEAVDLGDDDGDVIDSLDDYEAATSIDLNHFHKGLGKKFADYSTDEVARTIIKIQRESGLPIVRNYRNAGSTISDHFLIATLAKTIGKNDDYSRSAMSYLAVNIAVVRSDIQPDTFFSREARLLSTEHDFVVYNGEYYGYFGSGAFMQFSKRELRGHRADPEYGMLWASCALLYTSVELRTMIQLPFCSSKGSVSTRVWTVSSKIADVLPAHHKKNLFSVIKKAADILKAQKTKLLGWVEVFNKTTKKVEKKQIELICFVKSCMRTMASTEVAFSDDRLAWQALRDKTVFNTPFLKHEYATLTLGDRVLPYNNTVIKFVDGFLNLVRNEKSVLNRPRYRESGVKYLIFYAGVTRDGRNTQLEALNHFFRTLWGPKISESYGSAKKDARWDVMQIDYNGSGATNTIRIDADKRESVLSLDACSVDFDRVICVLDIAEGSVTSHLNVKLQDWLTNFLLLDKLEFVTTKYCCTSPLTVVGASKILPMNSVLFSSSGKPVNVGRTHGAEGICYLTPSHKRNVMCLEAMGVDKDQAFRDKCFEGSMAQFAPAPTFSVPDAFIQWFPICNSTVAGFKGGADVAIEIVSSWKEGSDFDAIEDTSDQEAQAAPSKRSIAVQQQEIVHRTTYKEQDKKKKKDKIVPEPTEQKQDASDKADF